MSALVTLLEVHGARLAIGLTAILATGWIFTSLTRRPVLRQRGSEATLVAALAWLVLAPLPRLAGDPQLPARPAPVAGPAALVRALPPAVDARRSSPSAVPSAAGVPIPEGVHIEPSERSRVRLEAAAAAPPAQPVAVGAGIESRGGRAQVLVIVYLLGALVQAGGVALGALRLRRLVATSVPPPAALARAWPRLSRESGAPGARLLVLRAAKSPFCYGLGRATVALPASLAAGFSASEGPVRALLRHELEHAARSDGRSHLLFALASPLVWFHPLFYALRARARLASEEIADDVAAEGAPTRYARGLIELAASLPRSPAPIAAAGIVRRSSELHRRIVMLLNRQCALETRCPAGWRLGLGSLVLLVPAFTVLVLGAPPVAAQESPGVRAENARLQAEVADLKAEVARLRDEVKSMTAGSEANPIKTLGEVFLARRGVDTVKVSADDGDTVASLLERYRCPTDAAGIERVLALNPDLDPERLAPGQIIILPARPHVATVPADVASPPSATDDLPRPTPPQGGERHAASGPGGVLDLVSMVTSNRTDLRIAERELRDGSALAKSGFMSQGELMRREAQLEGLIRMRDVFAAIINGEIEAAAIELQAAELRAQAASAPEDKLDAKVALVRAKNRVRILHSLLE